MKIEYSLTYDDAYKMFQCLRNERFLVWFLNDGFQLAIVFFSMDNVLKLYLASDCVIAGISGYGY